MKPYEPHTLPLECIDWVSHISLIGQANAALARYDGMLQSVVNPKVLLSPLTTQEAVLSSRIEGTQASMEDVLEYEAEPEEPIEESKQADIQEINNYRKAMVRAIGDMQERPFCLNLLKRLHETLLDSVRGRNQSRGDFRRIQNFIGVLGDSIDDATFVPPSVDLMKPAMENWEVYYHSEEKDSLVQLAVLKAQFELIHPFLDGNGRIGRMLVPLFLFDKKLLSSPMFYISAYLESNRDVYYERLNAISRKGDWNGWIRFFLSAIQNQARDNIQKTQGILELYQNLKKSIAEITRSQYSIHALDALFVRPIFKGSDFAEIAKIPTKTTGASILRHLQDADIVSVIKKSSGRRSAVYAFKSLINSVEGRPVV